jgi:hypothetical protein
MIEVRKLFTMYTLITLYNVCMYVPQQHGTEKQLPHVPIKTHRLWRTPFFLPRKKTSMHHSLSVVKQDTDRARERWSNAHI